MSRENPWTKHRQSFWQEKTGNPSLPLWIRVYALAYGNHRRNGHTPFGPGEVAFGTRILDTQGGVMRQPSAAEVSRAIQTAIRYGFLSHASHARCLVVPAYGIEGGMVGSPTEVCTLHSESKAKRKFDSQSQRTLHSESTDDALTCGNVTALYDSSLGLSPQDREVAS